MKQWQINIAVFVGISFLAGCTPNITPESYNTPDTQQVSVVKHGTIISTSQVEVSDSGNNWVGSIAGGAAGGVLGASMGEGTGSALLGIGGALLGGIAGNKAEQKLSEQTATQYIVQLTDGTSVSVTQGGTPMAVGAKVLLLEGKPARLIPDTTTSNS